MSKLPPPPQKTANGKDPPAASSSFPAQQKEWPIVSGRISGAQRILLYGGAGIGKTSLAALAPSPVFFDIEEGSRELDVPRIGGIATFDDLRHCLHSNACDGYKTIVIDTATRVEELAVPHMLKTIRHEKGQHVTSIEGYGFGKGYQHLYDTFLLLLSDCDRHIQSGRNVIFIAHDCTSDVPNPVGDDYIRYEPHLQSPKSGKGSIRNRMIQWSDYVLFIGYDVLAEDGKGKGTGTRTIWPIERPDHIAKARTRFDPMLFESETDGKVWDIIFGGQS